MPNGSPIRCGWQAAGNVPDAFDWWLFGIVSASVAALAYVYGEGIPVISGLLGKIVSSGAVKGAGLASAAAGALAVLGLVAYYLLRPDGCIRSKPDSRPVCCSGIVEQVTDKSSTAILILAPFAIGPTKFFDLVVKTVYLHLATQGAQFVICSEQQVPLLRCVVKSEISCGARIGSMAGAAVGAIPGVIGGYLAGAAIASLSCGPFAWLCFILAMIVAAIVAAAVTYFGAMVGGWIGAGIAAIGEDKVGETAESLTPGTVVTVRGDWTTSPDGGFNQLYYVSELHRTGPPLPRPYTTEVADTTPADDCPLVPPVIE